MRVVIPGAPPSVNHSYHPVRGKGGGLRFAKTREVSAYQSTVAIMVRLDRPRGWNPPEGYIRVIYEFYLKRDIDCDNAMKALNDAIALAIGVNDKRFLPCVRSKSVDPKEQNIRVEVEIEDPSESPLPPITPSAPSGSSPISMPASRSFPRGR